MHQIVKGQKDSLILTIYVPNKGIDRLICKTTLNFSYPVFTSSSFQSQADILSFSDCFKSGDNSLSSGGLLATSVRWGRARAITLVAVAHGLPAHNGLLLVFLEGSLLLLVPTQTLLGEL